MISFELSFWSKILFSDILQFLPLSKILCCWLYEQRAVCAKLTYLRPYIDKSFIFINLSITSQQLEIFVPARGLIARNARVTRILQRFFSQCYKWELQRFSLLFWLLKIEYDSRVEMLWILQKWLLWKFLTDCCGLKWFTNGKLIFHLQFYEYIIIQLYCNCIYVDVLY